MAIQLKLQPFFMTAACAASVLATALCGPVRAADSIAMTDLNGVPRAIPAAGHMATVLFFIQHDCPISQYYAPEMNRLCREFSRKGFDFYVVYAEPTLAEGDARRYSKTYAYPCPVVLDSKLALTKYAGATAVPEAAVLSPTGSVLYRGRIDNLYASYGLRRPQATTHDLVDALSEIASGEPVKVPRTQTVGCFISSVGVG